MIETQEILKEEFIFDGKKDFLKNQSDDKMDNIMKSWGKSKIKSKNNQ